jgi:hypothetical protein
MVAAGPGILLLFLLGGPAGSDLVTFLDPAMYFEARQMDLTIDKMAGLAAAAPENGKAQTMQLLALRYLGEHPDKLKKADHYAAHRKLLEEIAAGKRAQDPQGFAKEYAVAVLARLDGKTLPPPEAPRLQTALDWFPQAATVVGALDLRRVRGEAGVPVSTVTAELLKQMPAQARDKLYATIEQSGNVRIDRAAVAFAYDEQDPEKTKIYVRLTGKGNAAWLRSAIRQIEPRFEEKEYNDAGGKTITVLRTANRAPLLVFVGDTEMLVLGYARDQAAHEDVLEEVLAVRAGKQPSVTTGPLKKRLQKVPVGAVACLVGDLGERLRKDAATGPDFRHIGTAVPARIDAYIEKVPAGFDVNVTAGMVGADDAGNAVMRIGKLRKDGIDMLQQLLKQPDANPRVPAGALINLLQSLQVDSEGTELRLRVLVPRDVLQSLPAWMMQA